MFMMYDEPNINGSRTQYQSVESLRIIIVINTTIIISINKQIVRIIKFIKTVLTSRIVEINQ